MSALVVLFYNKYNLTVRCIEAILAAGYSPEDLYCFDNGSQPDCASSLASQFPDINLKRIENNEGFAGGFNRALDWVFNELNMPNVLFLTNDTQITSGVLKGLQNCGREQEAGMVAPCLRHMRQPEKIDSLGAWFCRQTLTLQHHRRLDLPVILQEDEYIPGTALWIDAETFNRLHGADQSYFMYWEDADLCFRASKLGIRMARSANSVIYHGIGQTCHKKPLYTTYYYQRNRVRFCRTHLRAEEWSGAVPVLTQDLQRYLGRALEKNDNRRIEYLNRILQEVESR